MFKLRSLLPAKRTFVDDVLTGRALATDIDDYIDRWHEAPDDSREGSMKLHEFLGLSWEEYRLWGEKPESLRLIIGARKQRLSVSELLTHATPAAAAARSTDTSDAQRTLEWLRERGRI